MLEEPAAPRLGRYVDLSLLGQGGMGAVYRGRDPDLDRSVAIKVVLDSHPDFVERFRREAKAVARLQHQNIVQVFDFGQDDAGHPYFVMELVDGCPLDQLLAERGAFTADQVASVLAQSAAGLATAHEAGIIHRDIKPSNLILDRRGRVKLVDFGIARLGDSMLTSPSSLLGTPTYMSPEQVAGKPVDGRTDLYSLGISCFHLLAGRPPFEAREPIALALMHLNDELPSLIERAPQTPPELAALIVRMCSKEPDKRPATAAEVLASAEQVQAQLGSVSRPLAAVAAEVPVRGASAAGAMASMSVPPTRAAATDVDPPGTRPGGASTRFLAIAAACAVVAAGATAGAILLLRHKDPEKPITGIALVDPKGQRQGDVRAGDVIAPKVPGEIKQNSAPVHTGPVRVAVLKFKNLSGDHALDPLEEGIGETVVTALAGATSDVQLVERNQLGGETGEIDFDQTKYVDPATRAMLGKLEGFEVAVQGSFQKASGKTRIAARFVAVETGEVLDKESLTSAHRDIFKVQDEVASRIKPHLLGLKAKVRAR